MQIATITDRKPVYTSSHRKERNGMDYEYAMLIPSHYAEGESRAIATLRIYQPGTVCTACLWLNTDEHHSNGSGKAGGYGYCMRSSAAGAAIRAAGIDLAVRIDGTGESAIRQAMIAISVALGHPEAMLHVAHA